MKKNILALVFVLFAVIQTMAQTYDNLWKQADAYRQKDLPKSEIGVMRKISAKASASKDYGQLLAAEMRQAMLWKSISPDSLAPAIQRMKKQEQQAADPVLKAVWNAVLGKLYEENVYDISLSDEGEQTSHYRVNKAKAQEYFMKALAQPEQLAHHTSTEYAPLTMKGLDGSSFGNDLLHLIGFEADSKEAYLKMYTYYNKVGNRGAACLCAFEVIQKYRQDDVREVKKSKYLNAIDSLIHVYQDIPEAGELAVEHYRFMEEATDIKPADKLNYINYALSRWGGWSRMNVLRNAQKRLTEPMFDIEDLQQVLRPGQKQWVHLSVRNLQNVKVKLSRLDITADNEYDVQDDKTYKWLKTKTSELHEKEYSRQFYGHPDYEEVKDSILLPALPIGAYLMEVTADNPGVTPARRLFYVSDLAVMIQQLPDDRHRYVVVSATSGQPIAGARIELYRDDYYDFKTKKHKRVVHARLTSDAEGEAYFKNVDGSVLLSTTTDKYCPARDIYLSRTRYYEQKNNKTIVNLYTDRAIYRPGQTVHAAAILAINERGTDAKAFEKGKEVKMELYDANWKVVAEKTVTTDDYGMAAADFVLPQGGLTGQYSVRAMGDGCYFRVEEYKRPTFEINFPEVNERYSWGDTVVVKATAKTYAGLPVQGAKVEYTVTRRNQLWWWGSRSADRQVMTGEAVTREDGSFDVEIPLEAKLTGADSNGADDFMRVARFFHFDVSAIVTDISGESHEGEMSLPLGTKPTAFAVDLPKRMETDSLKQVTFAYLNSAGIKIAHSLKYRIDGGEWLDAEANEPVQLQHLASGMHLVEAVCGQDSLQHKFVLFSMKDTRPMEETMHWSYQTATSFRTDGKPVYLQVGSSANGVHIVYSIIAGNKLIEKGAWELGDSIVTLPFTYRPEYASGIVLNYAFIKDGKCYSRTMNIARPMPEKKLNIEWKTFRNRLTPGQKEEWTLRITTPDGKPAKAQLMSVLYDKSLDPLQRLIWQMNLGFYQSLPSCYWKNNLAVRSRYAGFGSNFPTKYYQENELQGDSFNPLYFQSVFYGKKVFFFAKGAMEDRTVESAKATAPVIKRDELVKEESRVVHIRGTRYANAKQLSGLTESAAEDVADGGIAVGCSAPEAAKTEEKLDQVQTRENLSETAFFYPALQTDDEGNVAIRFTLPESITTWRFVGLAHNREMCHGVIDAEAVAQKTVMVQPNMPRFLREGDKAVVAVRVFNNSDRKVNGNARMQILDPETNKVVWQQTQKYNLEANGSTSLMFDVQGLKEGIYINKVVAAGRGYSDGEQHYLPVLGNSELVTRTLPITLPEKGEKHFDLTSLFAGKEGKQAAQAERAKVTIEYSNNPSWLMIQALPSLSKAKDDNAVSLMSAIYSNSIARHIMKQSPVIAQVVKLWKQEAASAESARAAKGGKADEAGTSLQSVLEKNQELRELVLNETPWVMDADRESEQKKLLIEYLDESLCQNRLTDEVAKLRKLQLADGSFAWWKGMEGSRYMTTEVAEMMVRLNRMVGVQQETKDMLTAALRYLQRKAAAEVKDMKKEVEKKRNVRPSELAIHYLYILSLDGRKLDPAATYLLQNMAERTGEFTIYGKARAAVVLASNGQQAKAADYLQSIAEYSVSRPGMGRYFDTRNAYYSWRDYKIPTQVAAIEATEMLGTKAGKAFAAENLTVQQAVDEMKLWLLQSKRTQAWDTPVNTVDAVYAFLNGKEILLQKSADDATIRIDGKPLQLPQATAGLGYVKTSKLGAPHTLTIDKKNEGTSWGAVYAQFVQSSAEIAASEAGIKVVRKVENAKNVKVGDKVKVVLAITADRDYDFVQVVDKRAACLEPVTQLSGYQWSMGCYVAPKDYTTNLYFGRLSKGRHVVEMEYYIDRKGEYQAGTCAAQCAYSPEFGGRAEAYRLNVTE